VGGAGGGVTGASAASHFEIRRAADGGYREVAIDAPPHRLGEGEVAVRPLLVGICGSDLAAHTEGRNLGCCFGHEWCGEVTAVGPGVDGLALGDRATSGAFIGCGTCAVCRLGASNLCPSATVLGAHSLGAARSWLVLPSAELVRVPEFMDDSAILIEPASIAVEVLRTWRRSGIRDPEALVVGAGAIGLLTALVLRHAGARVTLLDRCRERLAAGLEVGAEVVDAADEAKLAALERAFPVLIDCAHGRDGGRGGFSYVPLVRRGGLVIGVAKYPAGATLDLDGPAGAGLTLSWLRGAPRATLAETAGRWARLLHDRHRWLVSDEFPVARIDRAIGRALDAASSRKVVLRIA
jgi:threonine dehydrogenase-like Zn-dependent dehydrogenase